MTMAIMLFKTPMINMVTITFTSLILIEILNVFSEVSKLTRIVGFSCGGSVLLYLLCLYFFPDYLDASAIDAEFIEYVSFTVIVAWLPLFLLNWLQYTYYPTEDQKLMKQVTLGREGKFKEIMNLLMFWKKDDIAEIKKEFIELK
jgi:phospholipid-translocating ATPase